MSSGSFISKENGTCFVKLSPNSQLLDKNKYFVADVHMHDYFHILHFHQLLQKNKLFDKGNTVHRC